GANVWTRTLAFSIPICAGCCWGEPTVSSPDSPNAESRGLLYGFIGVACFSLTLPATRVAVAQLDPTFVGLGRALVAAVPAGLLLLATRQRVPARRHWRSLLVVVAGVIVGFP